MSALLWQNWPAILVASFTGFVLGGLWYGPLFLKPWLQASGMTMERGKAQNKLVVFGLAWLANLVAASGLRLFMGAHHGVLVGVHVGLAGALVFILTALTVIYLFESRSLKLWLINGGYQLVNFAAMGAILGAWPVAG